MSFAAGLSAARAATPPKSSRTAWAALARSLVGACLAAPPDDLLSAATTFRAFLTKSFLTGSLPLSFIKSAASGAKLKDRVRGTAGIFAPLQHPMACALLATAFASNIGTWTQDVGASWLMTSLDASPLMVSLIQTALNLPYFFIGLVAGALADIADRKRLLVIVQTWMLASAGTLGIVTILHHTTPWMLVGLSFSMGMGAALNGPAWQAIMPEMVSREELRSAVTLNNMQFNLARGIGPVIGGIVVDAWGGKCLINFSPAVKPSGRDQDEAGDEALAAPSAQ